MLLHLLPGRERDSAILAYKFVFVDQVALVASAGFSGPKRARRIATNTNVLFFDFSLLMTLSLMFCFMSRAFLTMVEGFLAEMTDVGFHVWAKF